MSQTDKKLLLKDLCARLPYGVKVKLGDNPNIFDLQYRIKFAVMYGDSDKLEDILDITNIKPYLFPISSKTKEQKEEFNTKSLELQLKVIDEEIMYEEATEFEVDFYNKHHLDWRGLIPKGLANDATGLNIY